MASNPNNKETNVIKGIATVGAVGFLAIASVKLFKYMTRKSAVDHQTSSNNVETDTTPLETNQLQENGDSNRVQLSPRHLLHSPLEDVDDWHVFSTEQIEFKYPQNRGYIVTRDENRIEFRNAPFQLYFGVDEIDQSWTVEASVHFIKGAMNDTHILNQEIDLVLAGRKGALLEFSDISGYQYICMIVVITESLSVTMNLTYQPFDESYQDAKQTLLEIADTLIIKA